MVNVPLESLLSAMPQPVLVIGPNERIAGANAPAEALFGAGGGERHYITVLRQPVVLDAIEAVLKDGTAGEARYLASSGGRDTTWKVTSAPIDLPQGRGALLSFEDVTHVEEAEQIRRDFVANVSHELRTPLTALMGFVETLQGPARDDAAARERFLSIMGRETDRMVRLVADLLSLSRLEAEERKRPTDPVDLGALITSAMATLEPLAKGAGVELRFERPDEAVIVPGDAGQLGQVLNNLIENAIKYGGSGGRVDIALGPPKVEPALRVPGRSLTITDYGEGIEEHHIPRLTERFYRVDAHRSREVGGTGLGLAIVKHIVSRHRGRLRIDSQRGRGTRFTVVLPI